MSEKYLKSPTAVFLYLRESKHGGLLIVGSNNLIGFYLFFLSKEVYSILVHQENAEIVRPEVMIRV